MRWACLSQCYDLPVPSSPFLGCTFQQGPCGADEAGDATPREYTLPPFIVLSAARPCQIFAHLPSAWSLSPRHVLLFTTTLLPCQAFGLENSRQSDLRGKVALFQAFGLVFGGGRWPMAAASTGFVDMPSCSGAATPGRDGDRRNTCYTNALRSNGPQACPSTRHKLSSRPWRKLATLVRRISAMRRLAWQVFEATCGVSTTFSRVRKSLSGRTGAGTVPSRTRRGPPQPDVQTRGRRTGRVHRQLRRERC